MPYTNIIKRTGSKNREIKFFKHLLPLDIEIVVEPFGGSFAVSKLVYNDFDKYKHHINDLDIELFNSYNNYCDIMKYCLELSNEFYKKYNKPFSNEDYREFHEYFKSLNIEEELKKNLETNLFFRGSVFNGCMTYKYNPDEIQILKTAKFTNLDYKIIFEMYHDNDNAFLFIDPPYLFSNNQSYLPQNEKPDSTAIIVDIYEYFKTCKCKVMLIINKLDIIKWLFKDYIKDEYKVFYQASKKSFTHLIICNY